MMLLERRVSFEEVREIFLQENPDPNFGSTGYALGLLGTANKQFGGWARATLTFENISGVMLPPHRHQGELVPLSGSTVSDAVKKLESIRPPHACLQRIEELSSQPSSTIFLSDLPIDHPNYPDYRGLIDRGHKGLTHLDGLHRLIAAARSGKSQFRVYIAGSESAFGQTDELPINNLAKPTH